MLLSIVVNLSSTVNGTQSAQQAASPLILSWSDPALMIAVGAEYSDLVLRSKPSGLTLPLPSLASVFDFPTSASMRYCTVRLIYRHLSSRSLSSAYKPVCSHRHSHLPDISDAWVCGHLAARRNIIRRRQRTVFVEFPSRRDAAEPLC